MELNFYINMKRFWLKGWLFGLGKVKVNDKHKKDIEQKITTVLDDFTRNFLENSKVQICK